jgi:hypothetical protein
VRRNVVGAGHLEARLGVAVKIGNAHGQGDVNPFLGAIGAALSNCLSHNTILIWR